MALPAHVFQEVAEKRPIHSLPHRREGIVLGLINIRGELLVAVSLERLLHLPAATETNASRSSRHRVLVANWDGDRFALPVNEVEGLCRFDTGDLRPPPVTIVRDRATYTAGVLHCQGRTVGLLDPNLLFPELSRCLA